MNQKVKLDPQFSKALDLLENSKKHLFITGNAGTGKSTLLEYWRDNTKQKVAVLAPTGVAALNVKGQTIHSFFGFRPDITVQKIQRFYRKINRKGLYKKLNTIVIDEISMVRADLLDCIDAILRMHGKNHNLPFGGIRMIFIGDLHQLPPVVTESEKDIFSTFYKTPYFFSANVFEDLDLEYLELKKIYRQNDQEFIEILDSIRKNKVSSEQLTLLNSRVDEQFELPANKFFITLTTTNKKTQAINSHHLSKIGSEEFTYTGKGEGKFDPKALPTSESLRIKTGAQIMMVANDREGRWVNGSLGKISRVIQDPKGGPDIIMVELSDEEEVAITPHTWEMFKIDYNPATDKLTTESVGSYTQYPLTLAWAITIHKSQGKTFDNVIIDFGWGTFAHGQAYVALSRCTNLQGIILMKPFEKEHIITDENIKKFLKAFRYLSESDMDDETKLETLIEIITEAINKENLLKFLDSNNQQRTVFPEKIAGNKLEAYCYTSEKLEFFDLSDITNLQSLTNIT